MASLDPKLLNLARSLTREGLERVVLQFVKVNTRSSDDPGDSVVHVFCDLNGTVITKVPDRLFANGRPSQFVAEAVLSRLRCTSCRRQLLDGEEDTCTLCEARQVKDLRRIVRDLS